MKYPWEEKPEITLQDYIFFMDTHVRVCVSINGEVRGSFAVIDDGTDLNAETVMPDGMPLVFKITGHPRTIDPIMTATDLVSYVLRHYK
jgi:hypothetical protein